MKKLLNLLPLFIVSFSCNVVKMIKQDDGKIPDDFYVTNVIPYPNNMLAKSYAKVKNCIDIIDNTAPVSFAKSAQNISPFAATSFGNEWDADTLFSDNVGNNITARSWLSKKVRNLEVIYSPQDKYESPTNRILSITNSLCAGGLILAQNLPDLGEFDLPPFGTYESVLDNDAIYALEKHCDITETAGMEGQVVSISFSSPSSNTIYDLEINFMGYTYFLRYTTQGMSIGALEYFDNNQQFQKVLIKDDLSSGLAIEYIEGPRNGTADDNETYTAMRIYYDSANSTGLYGILYKEFYDDSSIDSWVSFFIGGYDQTGENLSLSMRGTYFSDSIDHRVACISPGSWSIVNDGVMCAEDPANTIAGISTDGNGDSAFVSFVATWGSNWSSYSTLDDQDTPGFSTLGQIGTGSF